MPNAKRSTQSPASLQPEVLNPGRKSAPNGAVAGASRVVVTATVNGKTATVPRDAQRRTTQTRSKAPNAKGRSHDVVAEGSWLPTMCCICYTEGPDDVEVGSGVDVISKACKPNCDRNHEHRAEPRVSTETVAYVISTGYSEKHGLYFTRFMPLYDAEGAKQRKIEKARATLAALENS